MASLIRSSPLILFLIGSPAFGEPVIPNFTSGVLSSHTETKSIVTEDIKSFDYRTGYQLTIGGENVKPSTSNIAPSGYIEQSGSVDGLSTTYVMPDLSNKPEYSVVDTGKAFTYYETLETPGIQNYTSILRTTEIEQITDSTSTFQ
jgi:hypothetical protein